MKKLAAATVLAFAGVGFVAPIAEAAPAVSTAKVVKKAPAVQTKMRTCIKGWMLATPNITCAFALDTGEVLRANQRVDRINVYSKATKKRHAVTCSRFSFNYDTFAACHTATGSMVIRFP